MCLTQTFLLGFPLCSRLIQTLCILRTYPFSYSWVSEVLHRNSSLTYGTNQDRVSSCELRWNWLNRCLLSVEAEEPLGKTSTCVYYLRQGTFKELVERPDPRIFSGYIWGGFFFKIIYFEGKQSQEQWPQPRNDSFSLGRFSYSNGCIEIRTPIFACFNIYPQLYVCHNKGRFIGYPKKNCSQKNSVIL